MIRSWQAPPRAARRSASPNRCGKGSRIRSNGYPQTIPDWTSWIINWLAEDQDARDAILIRDGRAILGATGNKKDGPLADAVRNLEPGIPGLAMRRTLARNRKTTRRRPR